MLFAAYWMPLFTTTLSLSLTPVIFCFNPIDCHCTWFLLSCRKTIESYAQAMHKLVANIAAKLAQTAGLSGEPFKEWSCHFRMNKYSFTPVTLGSSEVVHMDSRLLTILQDDDNVSGLNVMDSSGSFMALDPWPGTFLVNLGDVAAIWSNGRWRNLKHRVLCKEAAARVSIATFLLDRRRGSSKRRRRSSILTTCISTAPWFTKNSET
ncbi:2-oxoglutarate-dependent dioxygenase DAO-like [Eucalyptus grandis]|uniref:2-oxoglutarate-dependent dioxygenase DAO-like n=1 Tax=Eucalyptus grandis TaxID=71139 RepID=UPI00192E8946|nr:2-oxoglutarate-dependent dioxygenase DAO-like [Eucalyptus grandis]